jgi:NAD(P)H-hydrate epimerase
MKTATAEQMRDIDRRLATDFGMSGEVLMDRAGFGVARAVQNLADRAGFTDPLIQIFAGRGNNGGDAFVAARYLAEEDYEVEVWMAGAARDLEGDALRAHGLLKAAKVKCNELPSRGDWDRLLSELPGGDILVDGLLGTGVTGPARGPVAGAIRYINSNATRGFVVSIDIPSGMNADTGAAPGDVICADETVTIGLPKKGLLMPRAIENAGSIEVIDIGIPWELIEPLEAGLELVTAADLRSCMPRRMRMTHKGTYGHALILAGSRDYPGAPRLALGGALRSGAGLVSVYVPACIHEIVAGFLPEAIVRAAPMTETGSLAAGTWDLIKPRLHEFSAILLGPGMTTHPDTLELVKRVLADSSVPVVLDADALNVVAGQIGLLAKSKGPLVLTPHPGELGRLLGCSAAVVQEEREATLLKAVEKSNATVILKGAGSLVATPGRSIHMNMSGNPGMATGGTGDVLAGLLVSLLAQGLEPFDAARAAVYVHGHAGDSVALRGSQHTLMASDLIGEMTGVFRELMLR